MPDSKNVAVKDANRVPVLVGVSNKNATIGGITFVQDETPVPVAVNPSTGAVKIEAA
jgi:hypothetical protein